MHAVRSRCNTRLAAFVANKAVGKFMANLKDLRAMRLASDRREASKKREETLEDSCGDEWLTANNALRELSVIAENEEVAKNLLIIELSLGRISAFCEGYSVLTDQFGLVYGWDGPPGLDKFCRKRNVGATNISAQLLREFWQYSHSLQEDSKYWNWVTGEFVVGQTRPIRPGEVRWTLNALNLSFSRFQIETLIALVQAGVVPKRHSLGGRPRGENWAHWTDALISELGKGKWQAQIENVIDLRRTLKHRMELDGHDPVDDSDARRILTILADKWQTGA